MFLTERTGRFQTGEESIVSQGFVFRKTELNRNRRPISDGLDLQVT
jgi:hypothetical protein